MPLQIVAPLRLSARKRSLHSREKGKTKVTTQPDLDRRTQRYLSIGGMLTDASEVRTISHRTILSVSYTADKPRGSDELCFKAVIAILRSMTRKCAVGSSLYRRHPPHFNTAEAAHSHFDSASAKINTRLSKQGLQREFRAEVAGAGRLSSGATRGSVKVLIVSHPILYVQHHLHYCTTE